MEGPDGFHHFGLVFGDDDVDFLVVKDALGTHARGDDGLAHRHRFDDLDADAASREQGHDGHVVVGHKRLGIGHLADDIDIRVLHRGEPIGHRATGQMIDEIGHLLDGLGQHLVDKPADAFLVGHPIHGADVVELGLAFNL